MGAYELALRMYWEGQGHLVSRLIMGITRAITGATNLLVKSP